MQARIIKETLLTIEFRQLGNVFRVVGSKLGQLLVNGDCLYGEAVLGVLVANFLEIVGSVVVLAEPGVEVANSVQDRQVLGVFPDNFFILGDSIRELPLLDKLLRRGHDLCFIETKPECHSKPLNRRRLSSAGRNHKRAQLWLKYHRKTAKPKPQGRIVSVCQLFTLKVRGFKVEPVGRQPLWAVVSCDATTIHFPCLLHENICKNDEPSLWSLTFRKRYHAA